MDKSNSTTTTATTTVPKTTTLTSASGERLQVRLKIHKKTGQITSAVVHSSAKNGTGKRSHATGARATHVSLDEAARVVFALVTQATKLGWQQSVKVLATAKPDAFDAQHIPAPSGKAVPVAVKK